MPAGSLKVTSATIRMGTAATCGFAARFQTPSITLTAANGNAATVYFSPNRYIRVNDVRRCAVPLTANQSFTLTGVASGSGGPRDVAMGTGNVYFYSGGATPAIMIMTYYVWD